MAKGKAKRRPKGEGSITVLPNGNLKMTITLGERYDYKVDKITPAMIDTELK